MGLSSKQIPEEGLLVGMSIIGEKFKNNEIFVPEVLIAARANLHNIGKNLVKMMLEGKGLNVIGLGVDVAPETFVEKAREVNAQIICCSALITTTSRGSRYKRQR